MTENRISEHMEGRSMEEDKKIQDVFYAGYERGVWDTMMKHEVFTDPTMAAMMCKELMELHGDKLVEAFRNGGDISEVIPTNKD